MAEKSRDDLLLENGSAEDLRTRIKELKREVVALNAMMRDDLATLDRLALARIRIEKQRKVLKLVASVSHHFPLFWYEARERDDGTVYTYDDLLREALDDD